MSQKKDVVYKVIVLGDGFVGKTAITVRFCEDRFQDDYKMTIGVSIANKILPYREQTYAIQLWDVAGQERFKFLRTSYYAGARGIVLVYDVTNKLTFQNLPNWIVEFQEKIGMKPAIVVGNKIDLPGSSERDPRTFERYTRQVTSDEGNAFADSINAPFFEVSAKEGTNINYMFPTLVDLIEGHFNSMEMKIDAFQSIEIGLQEMENLILYEEDRSKLYDALLKLKQSVFQENPYSMVLGNMNDWISFLPTNALGRMMRERLQQSLEAWKTYWSQSLQEGQAVSPKIKE